MNKETLLFKKLCRKAGRTSIRHQLLEENDRVLVGLSGGKDSLALLEILKERQKSLPFSFDIHAVHIRVIDSGYLVNEEYIRSFCSSLNIPLEIEEVEAGINKSEKKGPCFVCSWHRRKKMFDLTSKLNCNKLCFGHHREDALETLFINMLYHGSVSSLPYKLKMFDGRICLIRPLLDINEDEIADYAKIRDYKLPEKKCAFEDDSKRKYVRERIEEFNKHYPKSKINIFKAMGNIYHEYLPSKISTPTG